MQPTLPQAAGTADMDLTAVQSINDWFFKKEQIYLLAQFWQQVRKVAKTRKTCYHNGSMTYQHHEMVNWNFKLTKCVKLVS